MAYQVAMVTMPSASVLGFVSPRAFSELGADDMRAFLLTAVAMVAFAGNSILCRLALGAQRIDAGTFSSVRIVSGALVLWLIVSLRTRRGEFGGSWVSALALFLYVVTFSFAYLGLSAGTGALLLFGVVQASMISYGIWRGDRLAMWQVVGFSVSIMGLIALLIPGISAPPLWEATLMAVAGVAWAAYSLRGRGGKDPLGITAGNFARAVPMTLMLTLVLVTQVQADLFGIGLAIASGALTSGIGYAIWYAVLPSFKATTAAAVQLSVPAIATAGGALLLGEDLSLRLVLCSIVILGGIAIVIGYPKRS